ncbi:Sedlin [Naematelia encephala]|uniref:Sedlin n=1 Tax=Naematelia encephala TaxID=71784 RepID=A0A1Y2AF80_9TREE|nr:Sedlin [Naematelia encephala]
MSYYLALVSPLDAPLFELPLLSPQPLSSNAPTPVSSSLSIPSWSSFTGPHGAGISPVEPVKGNLGALTAAAASSGGAGATGGVGGIGGGVGGSGLERYMAQMVVHKSLDSVEEVMEGTGALYLKNVDRHNEWSVSAFLAGSVKFVLLHDTKNDDGIRLFFLDVWEAYVKVLLNPFHTVNTPIRNPIFEARVRQSAKRLL